MSTSLRDVMLVAAGGARGIVAASDDQVLPTFIVSDDSDKFTIIGWSIDDHPRESFDVIVETLRSHRVTTAAFIAEAVAVAVDTKTDALGAVDCVVIIAATPSATEVRTFVIDRSLPVGDNERLIEYVGEDMGGLDHSWLQRALEEANT